MEIQKRGWDADCFAASAFLAEPAAQLWRYGYYRMVTPLLPGQFENCSTRNGEIAFRATIVIVSIIALPILIPLVICSGLLSKAFKGLGYALQQDGYTKITTDAISKEYQDSSELTVMTYNVAFIFGGYGLDRAGMVDWRYRIDPIVQQIQKEDPDVLVLQEVYDWTAAEALVHRLGSVFKDFYMPTGKSIWGNNGGVMVCTKFEGDFSATPFSNNTWDLARTFNTLTVNKLCITGTHLDHKDPQKRQVQVAQIVDRLAQKTFASFSVVMGDFNIERDAKEGQTLVQAFGTPVYTAQYATCTEKFIDTWEGKTSAPLLRMIDNVYFLSGKLASSDLKDSRWDTAAPLSDHRGLVAKFAPQSECQVT